MRRIHLARSISVLSDDPSTRRYHSHLVANIGLELLRQNAPYDDGRHFAIARRYVMQIVQDFSPSGIVLGDDILRQIAHAHHRLGLHALDQNTRHLRPNRYHHLVKDKRRRLDDLR